MNSGFAAALGLGAGYMSHTLLIVPEWTIIVAMTILAMMGKASEVHFDV